MNKEQIREYITKYKDLYSRESIEKQLLSSGVSQSDIDEIYNSSNDEILPPSPIEKNNNEMKKGPSGWALGFAIIGILIPLIFPIIGIILGHISRGKNKKDGVALAALIIGYILLILQILTVVLVIVGFQAWLTTYQNELNVKIEQGSSSGSAFTIERLEASTNGTIYVKNNGINDINIKNWEISLEGVEQCAGTNEVTAVANSVSSFTGTAGCNVALEAGKAYEVIIVSTTGIVSAIAVAR